MLEHPECEVCKRIISYKGKDDPHLVKELKAGFVVLADSQFFNGHVVFTCKHHTTSLSQLGEIDMAIKFLYMLEMERVVRAIEKAFNPVRVNIALFGNMEGYEHIHWHLIPRHVDDPAPNKPIYLIDPKIRLVQALPEVLERNRKLLLEHL